jgi:hypothetical protein
MKKEKRYRRALGAPVSISSSSRPKSLEKKGSSSSAAGQPRAASIATRPCLISASRYATRFSFDARPSGSNGTLSIESAEPCPATGSAHSETAGAAAFMTGTDARATGAASHST